MKISFQGGVPVVDSLSLASELFCSHEMLCSGIGKARELAPGLCEKHCRLFRTVKGDSFYELDITGVYIALCVAYGLPRPRVLSVLSELSEIEEALQETKLSVLINLIRQQ